MTPFTPDPSDTIATQLLKALRWAESEGVEIEAFYLTAEEFGLFCGQTKKPLKTAATLSSTDFNEVPVRCAAWSGFTTDAEDHRHAQFWRGDNGAFKRGDTRSMEQYVADQEREKQHWRDQWSGVAKHLRPSALKRTGTPIDLTAPRKSLEEFYEAAEGMTNFVPKDTQKDRPPRVDPCPCGSRNSWDMVGIGEDGKRAYTGMVKAQVICRACGEKGPFGSTYRETVEGWNRARAEDVKAKLSAAQRAVDGPPLVLRADEATAPPALDMRPGAIAYVGDPPKPRPRSEVLREELRDNLAEIETLAVRNAAIMQELDWMEDDESD